MSRRRLDSRGGLSAGLLGEPQTPISTEPLESVYEITGELGRCVVKIVLSDLNIVSGPVFFCCGFWLRTRLRTNILVMSEWNKRSGSRPAGAGCETIEIGQDRSPSCHRDS